MSGLKISINLFAIVALVVTIVLGVMGLVDWWTILVILLWKVKLEWSLKI
jgi:hypothetical protein